MDTLEQMHWGKRDCGSSQFLFGRPRDYAPGRIYESAPNDRRPPPDGLPVAPSVIRVVLAGVSRALRYGAWGVAARCVEFARAGKRLDCSDAALSDRRDGPALSAAATWQLCRLVEVWLVAGSVQAARHALLVRRTDDSFVAVELTALDPVQYLPLAVETVEMLHRHGIKRVDKLAAAAEGWASSPRTMPEVLHQQETLHDVCEVLRLIGVAGPSVLRYVRHCGDKVDPWKGCD